VKVLDLALFSKNYFRSLKIFKKKLLKNIFGESARPSTFLQKLFQVLENVSKKKLLKNIFGESARPSTFLQKLFQVLEN